MVENDPEKFPHISKDELYQRQSLIQTSHDRLARAKQESQTESVKAKLLADERAKLIRRAAGGGNHSNGMSSNSNNGSSQPQNGNHQSHNGLLGARNDSELANSDYVIDSQARTTLLMQHQDETLDELGEAVIRVGDMAVAIHDEIGQQNKMLTEMEEDLATAEEELGMVMGKLAKLLRTKDKWQLGTILTLFLIMIVLLFLVIYV